MINLELTTEDAQLLAEVLDSDLRDLSYEIANTDAQDFRDTLKRRKAVIARALAGLSIPTSP